MSSERNRWISKSVSTLVCGVAAFCAVGLVARKSEVALEGTIAQNAYAISSEKNGTGAKRNGEILLFTQESNIRLLPDPNDPKCKSTASGTCGRTGEKIEPEIIVNHFTIGAIDQTANDVWSFFAQGSPDKGRRRGLGVQFVVGKEGEVLQLAHMYEGKVEKTNGVQNYNSEAISIEAVYPENTASSKNALPKAQYDSLVRLNLNLIKQYDIPLGPSHTWKAPSNNRVDVSGVLGHHQLNPETKTDPGLNFMKDLREDIRIALEKKHE